MKPKKFRVLVWGTANEAITRDGVVHSYYATLQAATNVAKKLQSGRGPYYKATAERAG
jgi:hypothetical protein